jgi:hypothetical protein
MSIYAKLLQIQVNLKAPKNQYNSFGNYKYRNAEDILEALKPELENAGCAFFISDDIVLVEDRYYLRATGTLVDIETGDQVQSSAMAREPLSKKGMDDAQITGSTSSYARKYMMNGLFGIDDTKDADSMDNSGYQHNTVNYTTKQKQLFDLCVRENDALTLYLVSQSCGEECRADLFNSGGKGQKTKLKTAVRRLETEGFNLFLVVKNALDAEDKAAFDELEITNKVTIALLKKQLNEQQLKTLESWIDA